MKFLTIPALVLLAGCSATPMTPCYISVEECMKHPAYQAEFERRVQMRQSLEYKLPERIVIQ